MPFKPAPNNEEDMKSARDASWLCKLFQEYSLTAKEKAAVIKSLINDVKQRKLNG